MYQTADQFFYGFNEPELGTTQPIQGHSFLGNMGQPAQGKMANQGQGATGQASATQAPDGELLLQQSHELPAGYFGEGPTGTLPQLANPNQSTTDSRFIQGRNPGSRHGFVMYRKFDYDENEHHEIAPMQQLEDRFCGDHPDLPRHRTSLCSVPMAADSLRWVLKVIEEPYFFDTHRLNHEAFLRSCNTLTGLAMAKAEQEDEHNFESDDSQEME